jgi:putative addiction module component (TIGR02574 family)
MGRPISMIQQEIRALTVPEKEALLATLLEELEGPPEEGVEAAWRAEIDRRVRELDTGAVESISAEQVLSRIDRVLGQ